MLRRSFTTITNATKPFKLAVVGSGPGGFYTAHRLLKEHPNTQIDMYDSLPIPHGLVRYGVAPDHPEVKNVMTTFDRVAEDERFRFFGNVTIGGDRGNDDSSSSSSNQQQQQQPTLTVPELQSHYDAILFSYGASEDRRLGVPNEDVYGSTSARTFVGWYNGLPRDRDLKLPLEDTDTAVVIGQGNVALDVARILLSPIDELRKTDITEYALDALSKSRIKHVHVVGRRGPLQAAFTAKELREQLKLPGVQFNADHRWIHDQIEQHQAFLSKRRPLKRLMSLLDQDSSAAAATHDYHDSKSWHLKFLRSPVEILTNADASAVAGIRYEINRLEGPVEKQRAVGTGEYEMQECGLVLRSIGYKSLAMAGLPFDHNQGLVPNIFGKIINSEQEQLPGMYTSGWLKRGPTGVIVSTMSDAYETADTILNDLNQGTPMLTDMTTATNALSEDDLMQLMYNRKIQHVSYAEWKLIEAAEFDAGSRLGKPREKFSTVDEMLDVLNRRS